MFLVSRRFRFVSFSQNLKDFLIKLRSSLLKFPTNFGEQLLRRNSNVLYADPL